MTDSNKENELQQGSLTASWNLSTPTFHYWSFIGERYSLFSGIILKNAAFFPSLSDKFGAFALKFDWDTVIMLSPSWPVVTLKRKAFITCTLWNSVPAAKHCLQRLFAKASNQEVTEDIQRLISVKEAFLSDHSGPQVTVQILTNCLFLLQGTDNSSLLMCSFHNFLLPDTPQKHTGVPEMLTNFSFSQGCCICQGYYSTPCALILAKSGSASIAFTWLTTVYSQAVLACRRTKDLQVGGQNICKKN